MKKIKVLEVIDKTFLGGGQKNLLSLIEYLDKDRFDVSVCSNPQGYLVDEVKRRNVSHYPVSMNKRFQKKPIKEIEAVLRQNKFDIIHTHGGVAGFYGRWAARKEARLAVVHTLHGVHYLYYRNIFLRYVYIFLEKVFSRFTDAVIFVSRADIKKGRKFKLASKKKMKLIENGIDFQLLERQGVTQNSEDKVRKGPVIGTVARLHRQKNIPLLLKAGAEMRREYSGLKILVIGDGPLRGKLESLNKRLGTNNMIYFLGERKDIPSLISGMDVFVLPSLWEGLPYVLLEAAALKKPVVGTEVDGIREMIKNEKTGMLVSPKKPEELAEAVMRLLKNQEWAEKMGRDFYRSVKDKYSISNMVHKIQDLYVKLFHQIRGSQN
ncbi:MAG: glycosyltransferase family 4 protein [Candidatus Aminicenantes bacterium]